MGKRPRADRGKGKAEISDQLQIPYHTVTKVVRRETWRHVP